jgi:hypothetical protein
MFNLFTVPVSRYLLFPFSGCAHLILPAIFQTHSLAILQRQSGDMAAL